MVSAMVMQQNKCLIKLDLIKLNFIKNDLFCIYWLLVIKNVENKYISLVLALSAS